MANQIILNGLTTEQFKELFKEVFDEILSKPGVFGGGSIDGKELSFRSEKLPAEPKEKFLTRGQVARMLQISLPTLHQYTKDGILMSYRLGSQVRYKAAEIEKALQERAYQFQKKGGSHGA